MYICTCIFSVHTVYILCTVKLNLNFKHACEQAFVPACVFNVCLTLELTCTCIFICNFIVHTCASEHMWHTRDTLCGDACLAHAAFAPLHVWTTSRVEELTCTWANYMYAYFTVNSVKMVRVILTYIWGGLNLFLSHFPAIHM